jgi:hypothetical protein
MTKIAKAFRDRRAKLKAMVGIQGNHGNWNYSNYMLGMYNGLELGLAVMDDRNPVFKTPQEMVDHPVEEDKDDKEVS